MTIKHVLILLAAAVVGGFTGKGLYYYVYTSSILPTNQVITTVTKEVIKETIPLDQLLAITRSDLSADLATYEHLSTANRTAILSTIFEASTTYSINPLILYSLIFKESSFRWWLIHGTDKDKDRACGLGGVRYSIHGEALRSAGIIETKSDLFLIEPNIMATAFIYNEYRKLPLKDGATSPDMSAMLRYFGGNYKEYFQRIDSKIIDIIRLKLYPIT